MSDIIKHECGIAFVRLLKPLSYYQETYGSATYGLNKMYLLMEKQHNRGQDGAGLATIKLHTSPGSEYIHRRRSIAQQPIQDIFSSLFDQVNSSGESSAEALKEVVGAQGEVYLGHLRYGTHDENTIRSCHPFIRFNNWRSRNLVLAGNFNLTNVDDLIGQLIDIGQHPVERKDTVTVLEKIGHFLDVDVQRIFDHYKPQGYDRRTLSEFIERELDLQTVLENAAADFDGGYVMGGMTGHGDAFVLRDPNGIRPAYWYADDEVVVVASERPCIQTTFNVPMEKVHEVDPGHALIVKRDGRVDHALCREPEERAACSFERIYFSRGTDHDIYHERKELGRLLADRVLDAVGHDYENTVFSFIPNTAETAFYGLLKGVEARLNEWKTERIASGELTPDEINALLELRPRVEKVAVKDVKMRTFITEDAARDDMVRHVYDITYGSIRPHKDTLVILDDSIVRGTTLEKSILSILDRLSPARIIVVSSAPQIRYPDCYGIDMSKMHEFVAFRALVALLEDDDRTDRLNTVYQQVREAFREGRERERNHVQALYDLYTQDEISSKIAEIVRPDHIFSRVEVIYQTVDDLHAACPAHRGVWYFTGDYPTRGGNQVVNRAFLNFMEGKNVRAY